MYESVKIDNAIFYTYDFDFLRIFNIKIHKIILDLSRILNRLKCIFPTHVKIYIVYRLNIIETIQ